jgi:hypothetical protein
MQHPNSTGAAVIDYIGSRDVHIPPGCNPNGLDTIHGPKAKNGGTTQRQILDVQFFRRFPLIPDEFGPSTSSIRKDIPLPFQEVQGRTNWMSYMTWTLVLIWTAPG